MGTSHKDRATARLYVHSIRVGGFTDLAKFNLHSGWWPGVCGNILSDKETRVQIFSPISLYQLLPLSVRTLVDAEVQDLLHHVHTITIFGGTASLEYLDEQLPTH